MTLQTVVESIDICWNNHKERCDFKTADESVIVSTTRHRRAARQTLNLQVFVLSWTLLQNARINNFPGKWMSVRPAVQQPKWHALPSGQNSSSTPVLRQLWKGQLATNPNNQAYTLKTDFQDQDPCQMTWITSHTLHSSVRTESTSESRRL